MADVETEIHEDGTATISLTLSPAESAALVAEASKAASIESSGGQAPPPPQPAAATTSGDAQTADAPAGTPVGPDTLTPSGSPAAPAEAPTSDALPPASSASTDEPPAAPEL